MRHARSLSVSAHRLGSRVECEDRPCAVCDHAGYTVAYTLPTAGFASTFMKTQVDPIIQGLRT